MNTFLSKSCLFFFGAGLLFGAFPLSAQDPQEELYDAIEARDVVRLQAAIDAGADVNQGPTKRRSFSVLDLALPQKDPRPFLMLYDNGLDLSVKERYPEQRYQDWLYAQTEALHVLDFKEESKRVLKILYDEGMLPKRYPDRAALEKMIAAGDYDLLVAVTRGRSATAICLAVERSDAALLEDLLSKNWKPDYCGDKQTIGYPHFRGTSPLALALTTGKADLGRRLMRAGADPMKFDLLENLVREGNLPMARLLFEEGADLNAAESGLGAKSLLLIAYDEGHEDLLNFMLEQDVDLQGPRSAGTTILHRAVSDERRELVKRLLELGADPLSDVGGSTAREVALKRDDTEILAMMQQATEKGLTAQGTSADEAREASIAGLIETCRPELTQQYLDNQGDPSAVFEKGPAVHIAASCRDEANLDLLLAAGADVDQKDAEGRTKFLKAAEILSLNLMNRLVERGADPNVVGPDGRPAFMTALDHEDALEKLPELLAIPGIEIDQVGPEGRTAFLRATYEGKFKLQRALLAAGANPEAVDAAGHDLQWHAWEGMTLRDQRFRHRTIFAQVSYEIPDDFTHFTGTFKANLRMAEEEEFQQAAKAFLDVFVWQGAELTRTIVLGVGFEGRIQEVNPETLATLPIEDDVELTWSSETWTRADGQVAYIATEQYQEEGVEKLQIAMIFDAEPIPLVAFVIGPVGQAPALRELLESFVDSFRQEDPPGALTAVKQWMRTYVRLPAIGTGPMTGLVGAIIGALIAVIRFWKREKEDEYRTL